MANAFGVTVPSIKPKQTQPLALPFLKRAEMTPSPKAVRFDEDISVAGLLAGQPGLTRRGAHQPSVS